MESHVQQNADSNILTSKARSMQTFFTKFINDWSMNLAGLLAYNLLMAMLPIAIAILAILGFFLGGSNAQGMASEITKVFPTAVGQENILTLAETQLAKSAGLLLLIAVILAIFSGSRLFITIEGCFNIAYRARPRALIHQNLVAIGMFLLFIILIPIMIFSSAAPTVILAFLNQQPQLKTLPFFSTVVTNPFFTYLTSIIGAVIAGFILFEAIYFIVPNRHIRWVNSWKGALVSSIALELFLLLFPIYASYALGGYAGQIGFAVILLLFFYYFAIILMLGAEVNAYFLDNIGPLPNDLVTFISEAASASDHDTAEAQAVKEQQGTVYLVIADKQEEQNMQEDLEQRMSQIRVNDKRQRQKKPRTSLTTALQVAAGSVLALLIEMQRQRRRL